MNKKCASATTTASVAPAHSRNVPRKKKKKKKSPKTKQALPKNRTPKDIEQQKKEQEYALLLIEERQNQLNNVLNSMEKQRQKRKKKRRTFQQKRNHLKKQKGHKQVVVRTTTEPFLGKELYQTQQLLKKEYNGSTSLPVLRQSSRTKQNSPTHSTRTLYHLPPVSPVKKESPPPSKTTGKSPTREELKQSQRQAWKNTQLGSPAQALSSLTTVDQQKHSPASPSMSYKQWDNNIRFQESLSPGASPCSDPLPSLPSPSANAPMSLSPTASHLISGKRAQRTKITTDFKDNAIVTLDVGGQIFKTGLSTLTKYPHTRLASLVEGLTMSTETSKEPIFLDRDGDAFNVILKFCRTGKVFVTKDTDVEQVKYEAKYYGKQEKGPRIFVI